MVGVWTSLHQQSRNLRRAYFFCVSTRLRIFKLDSRSAGTVSRLVLSYDEEGYTDFPTYETKASQANLNETGSRA